MIYRRDEQVTEHREHMRGGKKAVDVTALAKELHPNLRIFSLIRLEPGASIGYHVHEKETEYYYFLQGSGKVDDNGTSAAIAAGEVMETPNGCGHAVENTGDEELIMLAVIVKD